MVLENRGDQRVRGQLPTTETATCLYNVFHLNLAFSNIPPAHYPMVVDRCYWPLLRLMEEFSIPLGIECTTQTLELIQEIDPLWVKTLRRYWEEDRCEVIGSSHVQAALPLIPVESNRHNLALGRERYLALLGRVPETCYANEQTFSSGMIGLYVEAGFKRLIMSWEQVNHFNKYPKEISNRPQWIEDGEGNRIQVIWNHFIAFENFRFYMNGATPWQDYRDFLLAQKEVRRDGMYVLFGNDAEYLDYRPGSPVPKPGADYERLLKLWQWLSEEPGFTFATPSVAAARLESDSVAIRLETPEYPIPSKKEPRYNVVRWAVSGRDGQRMNTQCYQLQRNLVMLEGLTTIRNSARGRSMLKRLKDELCVTWGSDFRTHTIGEKIAQFWSEMGAALGGSRREIRELCAELPAEGDFSLINPNPWEWAREPFELTLSPLPPGRYQLPLGLTLNNEPVLSQVEHASFYPDGSVRSVQFVLLPNLAPHQICTGRLVPGDGNGAQTSSWDGRALETDRVALTIDAAAGGRIGSLVYKDLDTRPWIGKIPLGHYDNLLSAETWSSGDLVVRTLDGRSFTDLALAELKGPEPGNSYPIRVPVEANLMTPWGAQISKRYAVYTGSSRVDLTYTLFIKDLGQASVRLGTATFLPSAFQRDSLAYMTVNGGSSVERFSLAGRHVDHGADVRSMLSTVTAGMCLGATEGWIGIEDHKKGFAVLSDKSQCYSVPMVEYKEFDDSYLLRLVSSIGEINETSGQYSRGYAKVGFSYVGHSRDLDGVRRASLALNWPLLCVHRLGSQPTVLGI